MLDTGWDPSGWPEADAGRGPRSAAPRRRPPPERVGGHDVERCGPTSEAATKALREHSGGWIVTKLGPHGCFAMGPNGEVHPCAGALRRGDGHDGAGDALQRRPHRGALTGMAFADALPWRPVSRRRWYRAPRTTDTPAGPDPALGRVVRDHEEREAGPSGSARPGLAAARLPGRARRPRKSAAEPVATTAPGASGRIRRLASPPGSERWLLKDGLAVGGADHAPVGAEARCRRRPVAGSPSAPRGSRA